MESTMFPRLDMAEVVGRDQRSVTLAREAARNGPSRIASWAHAIRGHVVEDRSLVNTAEAVLVASGGSGSHRVSPGGQ
jgi:hypothetical protein